MSVGAAVAKARLEVQGALLADGLSLETITVPDLLAWIYHRELAAAARTSDTAVRRVKRRWLQIPGTAAAVDSTLADAGMGDVAVPDWFDADAGATWSTHEVT